VNRWGLQLNPALGFNVQASRPETSPRFGATRFPEYTIALRVTDDNPGGLAARRPHQHLRRGDQAAAHARTRRGGGSHTLQRLHRRAGAFDASSSFDRTMPVTYNGRSAAMASSVIRRQNRPSLQHSGPTASAPVDHPDLNPIRTCGPAQDGIPTSYRNHAPTANGRPYSGAANAVITLEGSGSSDTDRAKHHYAWDLKQRRHVR